MGRKLPITTIKGSEFNAATSDALSSWIIGIKENYLSLSENMVTIKNNELNWLTLI